MTQPGHAGSPLIELNGSQDTEPGSFGNGLRIDAPNSPVRGLVINRFNDPQLIIAHQLTSVRQWRGLPPDEPIFPQTESKARRTVMSNPDAVDSDRASGQNCLQSGLLGHSLVEGRGVIRPSLPYIKWRNKNPNRRAGMGVMSPGPEGRGLPIGLPVASGG